MNISPITVTLTRDEVKELIAAAVQAKFPHANVKSVHILYDASYSDPRGDSRMDHVGKGFEGAQVVLGDAIATPWPADPEPQQPEPDGNWW